MLPTLAPGDYVLVSRYAYAFSPPQRGDVVLFREPIGEGGFSIRRVVATKGDMAEYAIKHIALNSRQIETFAVGANEQKEIVEGLGEPSFPYQKVALFRETLGEREHLGARDVGPFKPKNWGPFPVAPSQVIALGDYRDSSTDSRNYGPVSLGNLRGKVLWILWSFRTDTGALNTSRSGRKVD